MITWLSVQIRTVKVSNVSLGASERDLKEFFSFSGDIEYVEMRRLDQTYFCFSITLLSFLRIDTSIFLWSFSDTERSQIAYVTFKDLQGAETAVLLSVIFLLIVSFHFATLFLGYFIHVIVYSEHFFCLSTMCKCVELIALIEDIRVLTVLDLGCLGLCYYP